MNKSDNPFADTGEEGVAACVFVERRLVPGEQDLLDLLEQTVRDHIDQLFFSPSLLRQIERVNPERVCAFRKEAREILKDLNQLREERRGT